LFFSFTPSVGGVCGVSDGAPDGTSLEVVSITRFRDKGVKNGNSSEGDFSQHGAVSRD
jgi:hypothetical protein